MNIEIDQACISHSCLPLWPWFCSSIDRADIPGPAHQLSVQRGTCAVRWQLSLCRDSVDVKRWTEVSGWIDRALGSGRIPHRTRTYSYVKRQHDDIFQEDWSAGVWRWTWQESWHSLQSYRVEGTKKRQANAINQSINTRSDNEFPGCKEARSKVAVWSSLSVLYPTCQLETVFRVSVRVRIYPADKEWKQQNRLGQESNPSAL
jgi:hypothetical protein